MPKIKANKKIVLEIIGKKVSDSELYEIIPYLGTDLESIGNEFIEVEIFPNRPDMLSSEGLGRALKSFIHGKNFSKNYVCKKSDYEVLVDNSVLEVRPKTVCAVIKGINIDDAALERIIDLQEKLHITHCRNRKKAAIGVYDLDKIDFPISYKALPLKAISFKPLGSKKIMNGLQILKETDVGKKYSHLVKGNNSAAFEDASGNILSMPPIVNSDNCGNVSSNSKNLFIEVSGFDNKVLEEALNILVTSILDIGGECYEVTVKDDSGQKTYPDLSSHSMKVSSSYINKVSGLDLDDASIRKCLGSMGIDYSKGEAIIPCYRADFLHPIDVVEDCIIGYGYRNIEGLSNPVFTKGKLSDIEILKHKLRDYLVGFGLIETISYNLADSSLQGKYFDDVVRLKNSLSERHDSLRRSLIFSSFDTLKENRKNVYPQSFFELGKVFFGSESDCLGISKAGEGMDYMSVKVLLDNIVDYLGLKSDISLEISKYDFFIEGRQADIMLGEHKVGYLGEVSIDLIRNIGIDFPLAFLQLDLDLLLENLK